jgi:phage/conjugal plasmid C-4 type zinc finger TraR family protein
MADECDNAQAVEALHLKIALKNAGSSTLQRESLHYCEECDEPIPEARRQAVPGVRLCVDCQEDTDACHN